MGGMPSRFMHAQCPTPQSIPDEVTERGCAIKPCARTCPSVKPTLDTWFALTHTVPDPTLHNLHSRRIWHYCNTSLRQKRLRDLT